jgi:hypothetical protein
MSLSKRIGAIAVIAGLAAVGVAALPHPAEAWWRGGCCRVGIGLWVPPVVVAPAPVFAPPPVYYAPRPGPIWVPGHWNGPYWVPPHWS